MASTSNVVLLEDEKVVVALKTEMYALSHSIIANIVSKICWFFAVIFGVKRSGQLTITNRRIILEQHSKIFWCFDSKAAFSTIMPNAIASVDYSFVTRCCCCLRKYVFSFTTTAGTGYEFIMKGGKSQAAEITNAALSTLLKSK